MEISSPDHAGPHGKYEEYGDLRTRIDTAISKGAMPTKVLVKLLAMVTAGFAKKVEEVNQ